MAINISIASDVTDVIRGTKDISKGLEDVADELENLERADVDKLTRNLGDAEDATKDLAKTADKAGERIEDSLTDAGKGADRLEKRMSDAFRSAAKDADTAGDRIGKSTKAGLDRAGEGLGEFKSEANSTARESAASFDGSADSIADTFQEVAANAFAGFGPAGAAAGLAVAVGFGIAISKAQELAEKNDEAKETVAELAREFYDAGGMIDRAGLREKIEDIAFALASEDNPWTPWANEAQTGIEKVREALDGIEGVDARSIFEGMAGDAESSQRAWEQLEESIRKDEEALDSYMTTSITGRSVMSAEGEAVRDSIDKRRELQKTLEEATGANREAADNVKYYTDVMGESSAVAEERAEAEAEASERQAEANERATEAILGKAEALDSSANAALGAEEAAIKYADTVQASSATILENGETIDINTEKGRANREALLNTAQAATALRDAQIEQGVSTADITAKSEVARQSFINQADAAGYTREEAEALADQYGLIPSNVDTYVKAHNVQNTKNELDGVAAPRTANINVVADTSNAAWQIDQLSGKTIRVNADVAVRPGSPIFH